MAIISISDSQVNGANEILVADSNSKIPAKDGSQITILNATNVASGTIASARLDTGTTANKLVLLDGSGNLPAIDASLLTGIVSATISASDPTISTNPSGGVGTEWNNSTSGEMFICTDATAGENAWKNVGAGTGDVAPYTYQGTVEGYSCGRSNSPTNVIQKYSFTADGNATDVGDMASGINGPGCTHSDTVGYIVGGGGSGRQNIEKFTFASGGNSVAMSAVLLANTAFGSTACTADFGYHMGGDYPSEVNVIQKWSHTADTNAVDVGDLLTVKGRNAGASDISGGYGYSSGDGPASFLNVIERFSFSSDGNSVDVGDMTTARGGAGASSLTHGYVLGGYAGGGGAPAENIIDKFSFASSANGVDIGNLTVNGYWGNGTSSTNHGYLCGGDGRLTTIDKTAFASDGDSTDVGDPVSSTTNTGSCGLSF